MIKNYLKIAIRSLKRNLAYSTINVLGLAIGISFSALLYIYVESELTYDTFHKKSDRIYRQLTIDQRVPDKVRYFAVATPPMAPALKQDYPEVEDMTRLFRDYGQVVFKLNGENHQEREWYTVESNFFEFFDFEFIHGDPATALKEPLSIVLNNSTAKKLFDNKNPVGELIEINGFGSATITAVVKDAPMNSHLDFNLIITPNNGDEWNAYMQNWRAFGAYSYILLDENADIGTLKDKMPEFRQKYFGPMAEAFDVDFQNIEQVYFGSEHIEAGVESAHGKISYVYIFGTMGIFILVIACINYINLATSKAVFRAKEIGIRKVVGAHKRQLIIQFITESFIVTLVALIFAIGIMDLIVPYFNQMVDKSFVFTFRTLSDYLLPLLGIALVIAFLAGAYPALYLAQLKPVNTLRGEELNSNKSGNIRKMLVVFQFMLTIALIVSTLVIGQQLDFIQTKDVGFDKENLIVIDINNLNVRQQFQTMKNEFAKIPGVVEVGVSSRVPGEWKNIPQRFVKSPNSSNQTADSIRSYFMGFDESMLKTYQFKLLSGSFFESNQANDSTKVLLNEAAVKELGLNEPIGSVVIIPTQAGPMRTTVIGILSDFNFQSLHQKIAPIIIGSWNNPIQFIDYFTLRFSGNPESVIAQARKVHEKFDLHTPMEFHFLDQQMAQFYAEESRASQIFSLGAGLSIFVACLGLFGLASFTVEKRRKELGIRKILGATESNLFLLLSSSFTKQIALAFILASPVTYIVMNNWLSAFQYRINIGIGTFLISGMIALAIAMLTISYRSIRAVNRNPVDSLRYE